MSELGVQAVEQGEAPFPLHVPEPLRHVGSIGEGFRVWAEVALVMLAKWHPNDEVLTRFLVSNTRSHKGVRYLDIVSGRNRLMTFLRNEGERIENGRLAHLEHPGDAARFEPTTAGEFVEAWNAVLWMRLGDVLFWRRDRRVIAERRSTGATTGGTTTASTPSARGAARSADVSPALANDSSSEVVALICRNLSRGASSVYFGEVVPELGRRLWGVDQKTLERMPGGTLHTTKPKQRMRILAVARRLIVALELGDVPIGGGKALFKLHKLAREALGPWCPEASLYQESRRAIAHILYMLEQLFEHQGEHELANLFGSLLDSAARRGKN